MKKRDEHFENCIYCTINPEDGSDSPCEDYFRILDGGPADSPTNYQRVGLEDATYDPAEDGFDVEDAR